MIRSIFVVFFLAFFPIQIHAQELSSLAETLFKDHSSGLYQIESISIQANKKNSVGSGFQISEDGNIVTNYHVVSDAVMFPELYKIRAIQSSNNEQYAQVISFDVIHDLAIIKIKNPSTVIFSLGVSDFNKGKKIFALGNPLDLGMTIMEGLSNGYMDKALYKKMLTTLALNPGMSGGPTLDEEGNVVGVNVATAGNSISFLVPVEFLKELVEKIKAPSGRNASVKELQDQLINQEGEYLAGLFSRPWENQRLGRFILPSVITKEFTCWGSPGEYSEYWLRSPYVQCQLKDDIYVSSSVKSHAFYFNYTWVTSKGYNPLRFNYLTESQMKKGYHFDLRFVYDRDVENFNCRTDRMNISSQPFWVSTCVRKLKQLDQLYDVNVIMNSLGEGDEMLAVELTLGGFTKSSIKRFLERFYKEFKWIG